LRPQWPRATPAIRWYSRIVGAPALINAQRQIGEDDLIKHRLAGPKSI
jgi:hypothetical protein